MRHYIRANTAGASYFFTLVLQDRCSSALVDHVESLKAAIAIVRRRHPFRIDAIVVLPDHLHALWTLPCGDADFSTRWMLIKQAVTRHVAASSQLAPRGLRGERSLWQRRFWEHQVRGDADFERHVDYIHFNPVKHGLAKAAGEWPHSSFHRYVKEGRLPADWGLSAAPAGRFGE
jgi:putative transposase